MDLDRIGAGRAPGAPRPAGASGKEQAIGEPYNVVLNFRYATRGGFHFQEN
jgi:hypothetical protein